MSQRLGQILTLCIRLLLVVSVAFVPLAFDPTDQDSYVIGKQQAIWGTAFLLVTLWLTRLLAVRRGVAVIPIRVVLPATALSLSLGVTTWLAVSPHMSLWGSLYRGEGLVTMLCYLLVALVTASELRDSLHTQRRWAAALLIGALGNALYALVQFAGRDPAWGYVGFLRPFAMLGNSVFLAGYLAMTTPVALSVMLLVRTWPVRAAMIALAAILYMGLLVTGSRIGLAAFWIAGGMAATILLRQHARASGAWILSAGGVLAAITVAYFVPGGPFARNIDDAVVERAIRDGAVLRLVAGEVHPDARRPEQRWAMTFEYGGGIPVRLSIWRGAIKSWQHRPVFGQGLDSFRYFPDHRDPREARLYAGHRAPPNVLYDRAHNEFLEIAVAAGVVGLVAFLWLLAALLLPPLRAAVRFGDPLAAGVLGGALAYLLALQFQPGYLGSSFVFWALLGFGAARHRGDGSSTRVQYLP